MDLQIEERELAWAAAELIHESTGQVTTKDGTEIVVRYLDPVSKEFAHMVCA